MLEHHERHAGIPRRVRDRHELFRSPEVFSRQFEFRALIENRLDAFAQVRFPDRDCNALDRSRRSGLYNGSDALARRSLSSLAGAGATARLLARGAGAGVVGAGALSVTTVSRVDVFDNLSCTVGPIATPSANAPTKPAARAEALPTVMNNLLVKQPPREAQRLHTAGLGRAIHGSLTNSMKCKRLATFAVFR